MQVSKEECIRQLRSVCVRGERERWMLNQSNRAFPLLDSLIEYCTGESHIKITTGWLWPLVLTNPYFGQLFFICYSALLRTKKIIINYFLFLHSFLQSLIPILPISFNSISIQNGPSRYFCSCQPGTKGPLGRNCLGILHRLDRRSQLYPLLRRYSGSCQLWTARQACIQYVISPFQSSFIHSLDPNSILNQKPIDLLLILLFSKQNHFLVSLPASTYNTIVTGAIAPSAYQHSDAVLATLAGTLLPGGGLSLTEPVLANSTTTLPALQQALARSAADLLSALKISGFIETTILSQRKATNPEIQALLQVWNLQADAAALEGQIEFVEVTKFALISIRSRCESFFFVMFLLLCRLSKMCYFFLIY